MVQTILGRKFDSADGAKGSLALLAFVFAACLALGPLRLFLQNRYYYDLDALTVFLAAFVLFLTFGALIYGLGLALRQEHLARFMRIGFGMLIAVFIFDNVLFFLVPELDGSTKATTSPLMVLADIIVIGLIVFLFFKVAALSDWQIISPALLFIAAFSGLQVVFAAVSPQPERDEASLEAFSQIVLSPKRNIVHVLFDMFQATEFAAALEEAGGAKRLPGFVWFKDSLGVHPSTSLSIPSVFAGKVYSENNMRNYYSGDDKTFLDVLANEDFEQTLFTALPLPGGDKVSKQRALVLLDARQGAVSELGQMLDLYFIRAVPFFAKDYFLNDYSYRLAEFGDQPYPLGNDRYRQAFANFSDRLVVSTDASTKDQYYFLHLIYPHPPFSHREDCSAAGAIMPRSPQQARVELRCALKDFVAFLEHLKEIGAYDETMIVMQGDTGGGHEVSELKDSSLPGAIKSGMPFPVMLVKDFGAQSELIISDKPASIQDIPNIVVGSLGLEPEFPGVNLMSDETVSDRDRYFQNWRVMPGALTASSWSQVDGVAQKIRPDAAAPLAIGDVVSFRGDGLGNLYRRGRGWSGTRAHGTWAYYPKADLNVSIQQQAEGKASALRFRVRVPGKIGPSRRIRYSLNGAAPEEIGFDFKTSRLAEFDIPLDRVSRAGEIQLSFLFDAPMNAQISDPRPLGFLIETMSVQ